MFRGRQFLALHLRTAGVVTAGSPEVERSVVARQVLIRGVTVDPIFADGAAKLRSRAAPSARIEPQILFLSEHWWLVTF